jgi:hypothetical protein
MTPAVQVPLHPDCTLLEQLPFVMQHFPKLQQVAPHEHAAGALNG